MTVRANHLTIILLTGLLLCARPACADHYAFDGQFDLADDSFAVNLDLQEMGSVKVKVQKESDTQYRFLLGIEHLKTPLFDLLSNIESSVELMPGKNISPSALADTALRGTIRSQYSLIDYKPVSEMSGRFEIKDRKFYLSSLVLGNTVCKGTVDLTSPYALNLTFNLHNVPMPDFLSFWSGGNVTYDSSGPVTGEIKASGTIDKLSLKGKLESRYGFVKNLYYDVIALNIEGIYPNMTIAQSMVSKSGGGIFTLDGPFDLSDKGNFKKQIKALTLAPLVSDSGLEREWTIKRLSPEGSALTELKYRFREADNAMGIGASVEDESDMFGIERTKKF